MKVVDKESSSKTGGGSTNGGGDDGQVFVVTLETIFSVEAPDSLCDAITHNLLKDPLFYNGNTYSKDTWVRFNGVHPLTNQPFQMDQCQRNLDKENEVDSYLSTCFKSLVKQLETEPTIQSVEKVLSVVPLLDHQRSCCLNAIREFKTILSTTTLRNQFQKLVNESKLLIWNQFINVNNNQNNNDPNNNNNNSKNPKNRTQKMFEFLIEKRKEHLNNMELVYGSKLKWDPITFQISTSVDKSVDADANNTVDELLSNWKNETINKSSITKQHCQLVAKKLSNRSREDPNVIISVQTLPSFTSQKMDLLIDIYGVDIIPSYISTLRSNIDMLLGQLVSRQPTISSQDLGSLLKNEKNNVEVLLESHFCTLEGSINDYTLYATSDDDWNLVNKSLSNVKQLKGLNEIVNSNVNVKQQQTSPQQTNNDKKSKDKKQQQQQVEPQDPPQQETFIEDGRPVLYKSPNGKLVGANQKPSRTLFIRNLGFYFKLDDIVPIFAKYGEIRKKYSLIPKRGILFLTFYDIRDAEKAKIELDLTKVLGREIGVHFDSTTSDSEEDAKAVSGYLILKNNTTSIEELKTYFGSFGDLKSVRNEERDVIIEYYDIRNCEKALKSSQGKSLGKQTLSLFKWAPKETSIIVETSTLTIVNNKNNKINNNSNNNNNKSIIKNNQEQVEEEDDEDNQVGDLQKVTFRRQFRGFIVNTFTKKWKTMFPTVKITILHSSIKFDEKKDRQKVFKSIKDDVDAVRMKMVVLDAPHSLSLYQPLIQEYQEKNQIVIEIKIRLANLSKSNEKQYGQAPSEKFGSSTTAATIYSSTDSNVLDMTVIGLDDNVLAKAISHVKSLFGLWAQLTSPLGLYQKLDCSQFAIPNRCIVSLKGQAVLVEATSKDILKSVAEQVQQKLTEFTNVKFELDVEEFEMKYLKQKNIIFQLRQQNVDAKIDIPSDVKIVVLAPPATSTNIKRELASSLDGIVGKVINIKGEETKVHSKLIKIKLLSIQNRLQQQQSKDVTLEFKNLSSKDLFIDFGNIKIYGVKKEVELIEKEILLCKSSIFTLNIQSDNLGLIIDYVKDPKKKDNISLLETLYNSSIVVSKDISVTISSFDKQDAVAVEKELDLLVGKEPRDSKIIHFINSLVFEKFRNDNRWTIMSLDKGILCKLNPSDLTMTITGNPSRVASMHDEVEKERVKVAGQFFDMEVEINKMQYDVISLNTKQLQLESNVLIHLIESDQEMISLCLPNGKSISLKYGNLLKTKASAIINPCNSQLAHGGGAALEIAKAAGQQYIDACATYIRQHGLLNVGQSLVTSNYQMKNCSFIINSVGPNLAIESQKTNRKQLLQSALKTATEQANKLNLESIASPAISSGLFGYPISESAPILIETAIAQLSQSTSLKSIVFVDTNYDLLHFFKKAILDIQKIKVDADWKWRENDNQYIEYDKASKVLLEKAYRDGSPFVNLDIEGRLYRVMFDANNWHQINLGIRNGNKRSVIRTPPAIDITGITIKNPTANNKIRVTGTKESIETLKRNLVRMVSSNVTTVNINKNLCNNEEKIIQLADFIGVEMKKVEANSYQLKGLQQKVYEVQIAILENSTPSDTQVSYPSGWDPKVKQGFIDIAAQSTEWNQVVDKIKSTIPSARVSKIQIVQNEEAYINFVHMKNRFKLNEKDDNETLLFHGSRQNDPKLICFSRDCFDFRFGSEGGSYGPGSYFARDASYSNSYAFASKDGGKQFFLAKVLLGESITIPPTKLHLPPLKPNTTYDRYDSVKGNSGGEIYIVYDCKVSYPYYLITYN
ncbi:hypothetical protein DFA_01753 [Cavenderia fasciculata]|uniref:Poly [ADP-ribose] polymerase n=1 Tax=Cavenderia fasciculata TaxID=261658 RepID=F4PUK3_CACFS|nr:uncharacterized protein DFA_01753 [Cavenderia fasciculata]EGG21867.1 hypothetical protein DFA_01753 [Cavenderia fasciculata]|eukprot:XP_004359718.1 hypothetical protein DFA_01753 [Cavenderia fasciculata]